ncbi:lipopolysaccharide assembly protein LapB [uncultured Methanofollis sp.]|uniref:tetratricopeptide repeat protein n=1 Tax=uncultured Methanofollis sp. TaxID=262500 RepID=UPI00262F5C8E|nr:tetratricopeptide repeat protein [uncultured Methanofollis sp.]
MPKETEAGRMVEEGDALIRQGNRPAAVDRYTEALRLDPAHAGALYRLGIIHEEDGEPDLAVICYDGILAENPDDPEAWTRRAHALLAAEDVDGAAASARHAVEVGTSCAPAWYLLGVVEKRRMNLHSALEAFHRASELEPDNPDCWFMAGATLDMMFRHDDAVVAYRQALEITPHHLEAHKAMAYAFILLERYEDAVEECDRILELCPDYAPAVYIRGIALRGRDAVEYDGRCVQR